MPSCSTDANASPLCGPPCLQVGPKAGLRLLSELTTKAVKCHGTVALWYRLSNQLKRAKASLLSLLDPRNQEAVGLLGPKSLLEAAESVLESSQEQPPPPEAVLTAWRSLRTLLLRIRPMELDKVQPPEVVVREQLRSWQNIVPLKRVFSQQRAGREDSLEALEAIIRGSL